MGESNIPFPDQAHELFKTILHTLSPSTSANEWKGVKVFRKVETTRWKRPNIKWLE